MYKDVKKVFFRVIRAFVNIRENSIKLQNKGVDTVKNLRNFGKREIRNNREFLNLSFNKLLSQLFGIATAENAPQKIDQINKFLNDINFIAKWIGIFIWAVDVLFVFIPLPNLNYLPIQFILLTGAFLTLVVSLLSNYLSICLKTLDFELNDIERIGIIFDMEKSSAKQTGILIGGIAGLAIVFFVIPYTEFLEQNPSLSGWTPQMTSKLLGNSMFFRILLLIGPIALAYWYQHNTVTFVNGNETDLNKRLEHYEFHNEYFDKIRNLIRSNSKVPDDFKQTENKSVTTVKLPSITVGKSIFTKSDIVIPPKIRLQNSIYLGPIGSGKTATVFKPQIKQDIENFVHYLRDFPKYVDDLERFKQATGLANKYLSGLCVIDTTKELTDTIYDMTVNKYHIPKDMVYYMDPTNPNTQAFNLLRGRVNQVVETVTNILASAKEAFGNDFFKKSERTHLKNYTLLLKLSAVVDPSNATPTFTELSEMYSDVYRVQSRVDLLHVYIDTLHQLISEEKNKTQKSELTIKVKIAEQVNDWFRENIGTIPGAKGQPATRGEVEGITGEHADDIALYDKQAKYVIGLRNTFTDMSENLYFRRVLFKDSEDFSLDSVMENGGILLCNTAKGELGDELSSVLGKIYLSSLQSATFRRRNDNSEPLFAIYADEIPDYVSQDFASFVSQARKFCVSICCAAQTPSQFQKVSPTFYRTVMSQMLTRGAFGNLGAEDAKTLSPYFGTKYESNRTVNQSQIDLLASQKQNRTMISQRTEEVPNITYTGLMQLQRFTLALITPKENRTSLFDEVRTDFINDETFKNNPYVFNFNNKVDEIAYKTALKYAVNKNPDFDAVDKILRKLADQGKTVSQRKTTKANTKGNSNKVNTNTPRPVRGKNADKINALQAEKQANVEQSSTNKISKTDIQQAINECINNFNELGKQVPKLKIGRKQLAEKSTEILAPAYTMIKQSSLSEDNKDLLRKKLIAFYDSFEEKYIPYLVDKTLPSGKRRK